MLPDTAGDQFGIKAAELGDDAGVLGAAALAMRGVL